MMNWYYLGNSQKKKSFHSGNGHIFLFDLKGISKVSSLPISGSPLLHDRSFLDSYFQVGYLGEYQRYILIASSPLWQPQLRILHLPCPYFAHTRGALSYIGPSTENPCFHWVFEILILSQLARVPLGISDLSLSVFLSLPTFFPSLFPPSTPKVMSPLVSPRALTLSALYWSGDSVQD